MKHKPNHDVQKITDLGHFRAPKDGRRKKKRKKKKCAVRGHMAHTGKE